MNNLLYASRQVFKPRMANVVKVLSLTIGLTFGAMAFTSIAYNYTFDTFYKDSDRICLVYSDFVNGDQHSRANFAFSPCPLAPVAEAEMKGVESATRFYGPSGREVKREDSDKTYGLRIASADKNYFRVFDLPIIAGDISSFAEPGALFISEKKAQTIFSSIDILGKTLIDENRNVYTIRGIIETFPENSSYDIEAISYSKDTDFPDDWFDNHWCSTFMKLTPGTTIKSIDKQFSEVQRRHYDVDGYKAKGQYVDLNATFIRWHHNQQGSANSANVILLVLGLVILVISGLNYVMLAVSSLNSRAKEIGVHKCNGASKRSVFALILDETLIYIILAVVIGGAFLLAVRGNYETQTNSSLKYLFCLDNLFTLGITILALFLVAGVIPAQVFSSIPVTQVFMLQSNKRTPWKKVLLFVQLFATVFVLCFLVVVIRQNNVLLHSSHGINMEPLVTTSVRSVSVDRAETIREVLRSDENVYIASISSSIPLDYPSLNNVMEAGTDVTLFLSSYMEADADFLETYEIPLLYGSFLNGVTDTNSVVVNERFVSLMGWNQSDALGKQFMYRDKLLAVTGVVKDFHLHNYKIKEQFPLIISGFGRYTNPSQDAASVLRTVKFTLALKDVSADAIASLNRKLEELVPISSPKVNPYKELQFEAYHSEISRKKIVSVASVVIFLLSFIGVTSYVSAEVARRKREIAIRRIQGSTIGGVLQLISQGVLYYAIAASVVGIIACIIISNFWLQEFYVKTSLSPWIFISVSLLMLLIVTVTTVLQSVKIVSANPAEVMRSAAQ